MPWRPALDTNLKRVLRRVFDCSEEQLPDRAAALFQGSGRSGGKLNQALMDVGALICTSRFTNCENCPLQKFCVFSRNPQPLKAPSKGRQERGRKVSVHVAAACIHRRGKYLVACRKIGKWEFPGGKREPGEDIRACLKREIREELGVEIAVRPAFLTMDFEKGGKLHRLHFCRSQILRGTPRLREHRALRWLPPEKLEELDFLPTNLAAIKALGGN